MHLISRCRGGLFREWFTLPPSLSLSLFIQFLSSPPTHPHTHAVRWYKVIWKHVFTSVSSEEKPPSDYFHLLHISLRCSDMPGDNFRSSVRFISFLPKPCFVDLHWRQWFPIRPLKMPPSALTTDGKSNRKSDSKVRARRMLVLKVSAVPPLV